MPLKRLLVLGLLVALALRLVPALWPGYRRSMARLRRRADLGAAAVMLALVCATLAQGEPAYAALVAMLSVPAWIAGARALRRPT